MSDQGYNGKHPGGRPRSPEIGYSAAHKRARLARGDVCGMADETCKGRLELALRHETPTEYRRTDERGFPYSLRAEDYGTLCLSHHIRYDKPPVEHQRAAQRARREREAQ